MRDTDTARRESSRSQPVSRKKRSGRDFVLVIIFACVFVIIIGRLFYIQVIKADEYRDEAVSSHMSDGTVKAKRGTIYDRNGEVLASSVKATTVVANPYLISDPNQVATLLERYLGEDADMTYRDFYDLITEENTGYVYIQRQADYDAAEQLEAALDEADLADGITFESDMLRVYPNGNLGDQVTGTVDIDNTGTSGLELYYDDILSGTDGSEGTETGRNGLPIIGGSDTAVEVSDGEDIVTSLDIQLQQKAEKSLKKQLVESKAEGGSVTVMDASTGEIYAACSMSWKSDDEDDETDDEEDLYNEEDEEEDTAEDLSRENGEYVRDEGKLWSVSDAYEPGSTMKIMTAAAILERSSVKADSPKFTVDDSLEVYDSTITDSHDHDVQSLTLRDIIAQSSNVGTVLASRQVDLADLYDYYSAFGYGQDCGIDFPGVATGMLEPSTDWNGVQAANVTFGQGMTASAMQVIRAFGGVEQNGKMRVPHFLVDVPHDSQLTDEMTADFTSKRVIKKKTAQTLTSMMRSVVTDGTGTEADIDGYEVVGKTGTAEKATEEGSYSESDYIVSFCGWLDDSDSDLVCLVTVDSPQNGSTYGGAVCGPVFSKVMKYAAQRYQVNTAGTD